MSFVLCFYFLWPAEINARGDEKQENSLVWPNGDSGAVGAYVEGSDLFELSVST